MVKNAFLVLRTRPRHEDPWVGTLQGDLFGLSRKFGDLVVRVSPSVGDLEYGMVYLVAEDRIVPLSAREL